MRLRIAVAVGLFAAPASGQTRGFDWNALGAEFCRVTLAGDLASAAPLLTASLAAAIERAAAAGGLARLGPPRTLFQSYTTTAPVCAVRTISAAIVEIRRSMPEGAAPAWTEYLVIVPEPDGASRIDDVLFATRRSDTLRARLIAVTPR